MVTCNFDHCKTRVFSPKLKNEEKLVLGNSEICDDAVFISKYFSTNIMQDFNYRCKHESNKNVVNKNQTMSNGQDCLSQENCQQNPEENLLASLKCPTENDVNNISGISIKDSSQEIISESTLKELNNFDDIPTCSRKPDFNLTQNFFEKNQFHILRRSKNYEIYNQSDDSVKNPPEQIINTLNTKKSDNFDDTLSCSRKPDCYLTRENSRSSSQESCYFSSEALSFNSSEIICGESHYFKNMLGNKGKISEKELQFLSQENAEGENFTQQSDESNDETELRLSQIDAEEESLVVEPFFNITPREMPQSPHKIIEESFKKNPWVMLVATIFLTKTTGKAAKPHMKKFFTRFPTPLDVLDSSPTELEGYFITLGMKKRGHMIWRMSHEFVSAKWRRASDLYGIGKYGEDAYRLFCLGHTDIEPTDRYLRLYLEWLHNHTSHELEWSQSDCESDVLNHLTDNYCISLR